MSTDDLRSLRLPVMAEGDIELYRGKGCRQCRGTGYLGRCGIFEIFPMSDSLKKMVTALESGAELRKLACNEGMQTLKEDAWQKVKNGVTTYQEALRTTGSD